MSESENKKIYEIGYHVMPNLSEEELAKVVEGVKSNLSKMGAEIIADQYPQSLNLAYDIVKEIDNKNRKFSHSFFGWVKFALEPNLFEDLKKIMDKNSNLLRYIIIKTVRESTLATLKVAHKGMPRKTSSEAEAAVAPIDEVAVDKKIDEMIDEEASVTEDLK